MATHSSVFAWRIPWSEKPGGYTTWGCKELDMTERPTLSHLYFLTHKFRLNKSQGGHS